MSYLYICVDGLDIYLGPFSLRLSKNSSQLIVPTWSLVFSLPLVLWLLLCPRKKIIKFKEDTFLLLLSASPFPLSFFIQTSEQFLIKFAMNYIGVSFENFVLKSFETLPYFDVWPAILHGKAAF